MNLVDVAEVLYQIRLALESVKAIGRVPFVKMYLENAQGLLVMALRNAGYEPGKSVKDVDDCKRQIIQEQVEDHE